MNKEQEFVLDVVKIKGENYINIHKLLPYLRAIDPFEDPAEVGRFINALVFINNDLINSHDTHLPIKNTNYGKERKTKKPD